jgi:rhamnogalacturonyl hydrolase YesR
MLNKVLKSFQKLKNHVESEKFKGWDPFDGLNSRFFQSFPLLKNYKWPRLAWLQFFKRSPLNFRKLFLVSKQYNPKALGLFLTGYCNLYHDNPNQKYLKNIQFLADKLIELQTKGYSGACWGYNFDWQARAFFQPKNTPTVVATAFITEALLEAYKITNHNSYLKTAISAKDFILNDLNRSYDDENNYCFSYSPLDKTQVFNAGLLGAKTLSLIYAHTHEKYLLTEARKVINFVVKHQQDDGAWSYGTLPYHQWIDNFHTGYNLEAIYMYQQISGDKSFNSHINKAFSYYINTFFTSEGKPKYYHNQLYPIDIHAPAQLLVSLSKMNKFFDNIELINKVINWTIENMQAKNGGFYYQKKKFFTSKIPYMRWSNAWMFYSLTYYLKEFHKFEKNKK